MPAARAIPLGFVAGLVSALFLLLTSTGNLGAMILGGMALLPVLLAGFGAGTVAMGTAVAIGLAITSLLGGLKYGLAFVEMIAVPSGLVVPLALAAPKVPSARRMVFGITGLGCAAFTFIFVAMHGRNGGLMATLEAKALTLLTEMQKSSDLQLPVPAEKLAATIAFWALGATIAVWMLNIIGNALLAQGALSRFERTLRPTPSMTSLDLPYPVSLVFAVAVAVWWFGHGEVAFIGANLAEILAVPLMLCGFAVIHAVIGATVRRPPARLAMLLAIYPIAFVSLWPIAMIVVLGIAEQWIGLRQRLAGEPKQGV